MSETMRLVYIDWLY